MEALAWIEQTAFSIWVREEPFVFPFVLAIHSLGMGLSAGVAIAMSLRVLGFAPGLVLVSLPPLKVLVWLGLIANAVSGLVLLAAYPAKALTNPVFYIKLILMAAALWIMVWQARTIFALKPSRYASSLAIAAILCWIGVIFAGRFLAYTHSVLLATWAI
jgi:hypothetical protein